MCYLQIQSKWYINPKSDEKNVRIPSKSPWKIFKLTLPKNYGNHQAFFVSAFCPSCSTTAVMLRNSHQESLEDVSSQKLTIFNKIGREHPWDLTDLCRECFHVSLPSEAREGGWRMSDSTVLLLPDMRFGRELHNFKNSKHFDQSKSILMYHIFTLVI